MIRGMCSNFTEYIPSQNVKNHRPQINAGHFHPLCDVEFQSRQQFERDRNLYDADIKCIKRGQFEVSAIKISTHFHLFLRNNANVCL